MLGNKKCASQVILVILVLGVLEVHFLKKRICSDFLSRVFSKWASKIFSLQKLIRITHKSFLSEIAEMLEAYRLKRNPDLLEKFSKNVCP